MKNNRLSLLIRIMMAICGVALAIVIVVPLWRIELDAPQYPEGLSLLIYPNKLGGNVDIVNGLNHYIGMKTLHASDFIEFTILPYIIGFFSLLALLVAIVGKPKLLKLFFILFVSFGIIGMVDFWRWEYNYGHDLNPEAAIVVPGMSYQPPLIGFKQLLNFGAYSVPDTGGWIFIIVGLISAFALWLNWKNKKQIILSSLANKVVLLLPIVLASSCNNGPQAIKLGIDACYFCKMTISDARFGAEIITKKGRTYLFDDSYCLLNYLKSKDLTNAEIQDIYISDFTSNHQLLKIKEAQLFQSNEIRGPMGGNIAAFSNVDSLKKVTLSMGGNTINWESIYK
ncbi:MAG: nitrous oxide reductase accessory protein NosL [Sediminibacterium sp.]|nr:nitrous oxide reductase accessory protein NosL [Sediminibacterium sp.]